MPGRPIDPLVAEDRSARDVRGRTGPESWSVAPAVARDNRGSSRTLLKQFTGASGSSTDGRAVAYNDEVSPSRYATLLADEQTDAASCCAQPNAVSSALERLEPGSCRAADGQQMTLVSAGKTRYRP